MTKYYVRLGGEGAGRRPKDPLEVEIEGGRASVGGVSAEVQFAAIPGTPLYHLLLGGESWTQTWRHQLRWARTIRVSRPAGYYGYVVTHATFWSLVAFASGHWLAGAGALAVRMVAGIAVGAGILKDRHVAPRFWLIPWRDLFGFAVWLAAIFGHHVDWRDRSLLLHPDGRIHVIR